MCHFGFMVTQLKCFASQINPQSQDLKKEARHQRHQRLYFFLREAAAVELGDWSKRDL